MFRYKINDVTHCYDGVSISVIIILSNHTEFSDIEAKVHYSATQIFDLLFKLAHLQNLFSDIKFLDQAKNKSNICHQDKMRPSALMIFAKVRTVKRSLKYFKVNIT